MTTNSSTSSSSTLGETTEEMRKAFSNFFSESLSCSDLSAVQQIKRMPRHLADSCREGSNGGGGGGHGDMEGAVTLDWRGDPFTSMSDLTLVIYDGTGSGGAAYHVHTLLLVYGGRKSGFVVEQVRNASGSGGKKTARGTTAKSSSLSNNINNNNNHSNHSRQEHNDKEAKVEIYVPPLAARHIPALLDYIYGASPQLSTSNAPSLRYLANRFDIRELHSEISLKFIPRDLELHTAPQYCMAADDLKDFELRDRALNILAERLDKLNNGNLLREMSPRLMRSLVQCERLNAGGNWGLSEKVAMWLRSRDELLSVRKTGQFDSHIANINNKNNVQNTPILPLTDEDFYWLTHVQKMPEISPYEALFYLNYGSINFPQVMNEVGSGSLKSRCFAAISGSAWCMDKFLPHLEDLGQKQQYDHHPSHHPQKQKENNPSLELYECLPLDIKVQLLESSLVGAKKLMMEREQHGRGKDDTNRDMQLSEELMFKKLKEASLNSSLTSSSSSSSSSPPMKVVVLGCGIPSANGIYIYNPSSKQDANIANIGAATAVIYEKEAVWNQQRVTFLLYSTAAGQYYTQYKLSMKRSESNQILILYNSPTVMGTSSSPFLGGRQGNWNHHDGSSATIPEKGWAVEGEGVHPPPQFVGKLEQPTVDGSRKSGSEASIRHHRDSLKRSV
eukprot:CAMPEP_0171340660 /NCGR_PEP_ID=MMETSP0878-20121228/8719_1 /TAXON_ID=67004 /ORGANISM="Thalassiosira weissflogii, Strain CCMP1336" /LENGTH=673 /DNA_ID=CAMNT_0011842775 /DNA_START=230 /DNA_END=2251 /DNA_ORIENTATION=+